MNKREKEKNDRINVALSQFEATKEAVFEALDCSHEYDNGKGYSADVLFKEFLEKLDRCQPQDIMGDFSKFVDTPGNYSSKKEEAEFNIIYYYKQHFQEESVLLIYGWYCQNWRTVWDWVHTRHKKSASVKSKPTELKK